VVTVADAMDSNQRIAHQVGAAIRRLRIERGRTQRQLAAAAGIPEAALSAYERGQQLPDLRTLGLMLAALHVSADEFGRHLGPWGGSEPKLTLTVHR
jgi:transcriptional regulator with XRE-family HTH domain